MKTSPSSEFAPQGNEATTRIDLSHVPPEVKQDAVRPQRTRAAAVVKQKTLDPREVGIDLEALGRKRAPCITVEPPEAIPDLVVRHADDLSVHLATRLAEVERREVALAQHEQMLREAEANARLWVGENDSELTARERAMQFQADELSTQFAALAAAEIAAEQEAQAQREALQERENALQRRMSEMEIREERLREEAGAVQHASEKLRAERRKGDELARSRQQQWQTLQLATQAQTEKLFANLAQHRFTLDEREQKIAAREEAYAQQVGAKPILQDRVVETAPPRPGLEESLRRAEATRDHRTALEHRWIAGQLWAKLVGSALASDEELTESLEQVRAQLELLYRREREALEDIRASLDETARQLLGPTRKRPATVACRRGPKGASFSSASS